MARFDAERRGASPQVLPEKLHLQWQRQLPALTPAWPDQPKMQFDEAYSPVVAGQRLFLVSSKHDWVSAFDTRTGKELWRFFAEGPVRFAPVVWEERLFFVSDDGYLYCLDAEKGELHWKHRGGPGDRKILGNDRLVSTWPARGAPVIVDGTVYYGSSIWPFMGIFIHALDARSGKVIWTNDGEGTNYIKQPHNTDSFATVAPQGHLAVIGDRLIVPGGRSIPALFDRLTGNLLQYKLAENGKRGGGSEVAVASGYFFNGGAAFELATQKHRAEIGDPVAISESHLVSYQGGSIKVFDFLSAMPPGEETTIDRTGKTVKKARKWTLREIASAKMPPPEDIILSGGRVYAAVKGRVLGLDVDEANKAINTTWQSDVPGAAMRLLTADDRLFVVTREGNVLCYGEKETKAVENSLASGDFEAPRDEWTRKTALILDESRALEGYAIVIGVGSGRLIQELHKQSKLKLFVVESNPVRARSLRDQIVKANLDRVSVLQGDAKTLTLPPYLANLIVSEGGADLTQETLVRLFQSLRPFGGTLALPDSSGLSILTRETKLESAAITDKGGFRFVERAGALPGSANWTHEHADASNTRVSKDVLVKAPLGILWFGGPPNDAILPRHGHGPQPQVIDGRLIIEGVDLIRAIDIYTGRLLWETRLPGVGRFFNNVLHQPGANASGSNFVCGPDGVYVAWDNSCVRLNLDTGAIDRKYQLPPKAGSKGAPLWGYINLQGPYLVGGAETLLDPRNLPIDPKTAGPGFGADRDPGEKTSSSSSSISKLLKSIKTFNDNMSASKRLVVLDRATGKVLWTVDAESYFRHNATILGGGKLFTIDRLSGEQLAKYKRTGEDPPHPSRLRVFDLKTGKELWSTDADVFGTWLSYSEKHDVLLESGRVARDALLDEPKGMRAYDVSTGDVLWTQKSYTGPAMVLGDEVLQGQGACDIKTGKQKMRIDPITEAPAPWTWVRNYGCNTPGASQNLLTFRSGAAGFFDLCGDSGTGNLGGFRSSCTNNLIVAGGVLTAPDYTRTCTCAYQNQTSVGLVHMPEVELWTCFGTKEVKGAIRRLGLNFGAPGDHRAEEGTLWLEYPGTGGVSPAVQIKTRPSKLEYFRRHGTAIEGVAPQVCASGVRGIESITITLDKFAARPTKYTLRFYFAEPEDLQAGQRVFKVEAQDQVLIERVDVAKEAGGPRRSLVREFKGVSASDELFIRLTPLRESFVPSTILNGLEIIAED